MLLVKTHHRGWDTPGGQIEVGEDIEAGVLRMFFYQAPHFLQFQ
jgi:ADP-ribose pyrophosphatase YjhB (NUDIX family)